jgi:hypothetical protein
MTQGLVFTERKFFQTLKHSHIYYDWKCPDSQYESTIPKPLHFYYVQSNVYV